MAESARLPEIHEGLLYGGVLTGVLPAMPGDYQYDVFLSYRREWPALDWVQNHFSWRLEKLLGEFMPPAHAPKIFVDTKEIETGQEWPLVLREALKNSRCLVAVWSPEYFRSKWCVAELGSMMEREKLLGYRTEANPESRLVYPVVFNDGIHFPDYTKGILGRDLRTWNYPDPIFAKTKKIVGFHDEMKSLAEELANLILQVPPWREDWPIVTPPAAPPATVHVPRLP